MTDEWRVILDDAVSALDVAPRVPAVTTQGTGFLRSIHPVSDLAAASVAAVAAALAELMSEVGIAGAESSTVDRTLADTWFGAQVVPVGWTIPPAWDPLSGTFRASDTWIRLHANAPHHRDALLAALGLDPGQADPETLVAAVAGWAAESLEEAIIGRGGAAAALRSPAGWATSAPGRAVAAEPLIARRNTAFGSLPSLWSPTPSRPLAGVRVLDMTRVLAGPTATQTLAGLGADVLRIDPPTWDEPAVLPLVMWGKRSIRLDARTPDGAAIVRELLSTADVIVHGYRAGALAHLGLSEAEREAIRPGLIDVSERAYGFSGPWAGRRGFDSLVQFATGLAHPLVTGTEEPLSLPVQALDFATGYLTAAAAIAGLARRARTGRGSTWGLSLARTALALQQAGERRPAGDEPGGAGSPAVARIRADTRWGAVERAESPFRVGDARMAFDGIALPLGGDRPEWLA